MKEVFGRTLNLENFTIPQQHDPGQGGNLFKYRGKNTQTCFSYF